MPELSPISSRHNKTPRSRQYLGVALGGAVLLAGGNASLGSCGSSVKQAVNKPVGGNGGEVSQRVPVIVTKDPATEEDLTLDCIDYYKSDGMKTSDSALQGPRAMVFESDISLFAVKITGEYGQIGRAHV